MWMCFVKCPDSMKKKVWLTRFTLLTNKCLGTTKEATRTNGGSNWGWGRFMMESEGAKWWTPIVAPRSNTATGTVSSHFYIFIFPYTFTFPLRKRGIPGPWRITLMTIRPSRCKWWTVTGTDMCWDSLTSLQKRNSCPVVSRDVSWQPSSIDFLKGSLKFGVKVKFFSWQLLVNSWTRWKNDIF